MAPIQFNWYPEKKRECGQRHTGGMPCDDRGGAGVPRMGGPHQKLEEVGKDSAQSL